jgi:cell division protein FtsB
MIRDALLGSPLYRLALASSTALSLVITGAALFGEDGLSRHEMLRAELAQLERLNRDLDAENARLSAEAASLRDDPEYLESAARDELGWARPDEVIFIFPAAPQPASHAEARHPSPRPQPLELAEAR